MDKNVELTEEDVHRITDYLDVDAPTDEADLAFVFGGRFTEPAYIAADLFKQGVVKYILLSGGVNRITGRNEAETHLGIVLQEGVPRDHIIVENESTNTYEQALWTLPRLSAQVDLASIKRVVVITKWYHCRRAMMTLKRSWPEGIHYFTKCFEPEGIPRTQWWLHEASRKRALKEWQRIPYYMQAGYLADIHKGDDGWV